jgi:hypothetical protein
MMNGSALMRKEHFKKNIKTKYVPPGNPILSHSDGLTSSAKLTTKVTSKKAKGEKISKAVEEEFNSSKKNKGSSRSSKRTQSTAIPTIKANVSAQRSVSTVKKDRSKSKKDKHKKKF